MRHHLAAPLVAHLARALAIASAAMLGIVSSVDAQHPSVWLRGGSAATYTRYGYLDRTQKLVSPFQYDTAGDFSEETALVFQDAKWRMIDTMGARVGDVPDSLKFLSNVHGGLLRVKTTQGTIGFLNVNGSYAITPQFTKASDFSE